MSAGLARKSVTSALTDWVAFPRTQRTFSRLEARNISGVYSRGTVRYTHVDSDAWVKMLR